MQQIKLMTDRLTVLENGKVEEDIEDTFDYSLLSDEALDDIANAELDSEGRTDLSKLTLATLDELKAALVTMENANAEE